MKANKDRASLSTCVRFNDKHGFKTKFNKTNFPNEPGRLMYYCSVKFVEQGMQGPLATKLAEKNKKLHEFLEVAKELKVEPSPDGFGSFKHLKKRQAVSKLIDKFYNELVAAMGRRGLGQGVDNILADGPNAMQVGEGSARQFNATVREDVNMQASSTGQIQAGDVRTAAPNPGFGNTLPAGAPPQPVPCNEKNFQSQDVQFDARDLFIFSDFDGRTSLEGALVDAPNAFSRSRQEEILALIPPNEVPSTPERLANEFWSYETAGRSSSLFAG